MSASLAVGIVGGVVGFFVGGPAGAQVGFMLGSVAGGLLFPPKGPDGPRMEDLRPQSSEYGRPIAQVKGTIGIPGNVVWASEYVEEASEEGGGCGEPSFTSFSYYGNFAVKICVGEKQLGRIWAGPEKRLIYDGARLEGEDSGAELRFYSGTEDQLPDALIESYEGIGNVPAWRGWCYVVFEHFPLINDGNSIPFLTIEVGTVDVDSHDAPPDLAIVGWSQLIVGSDYYFAFFHGSYYGVVIRRLSDNSLVQALTYTDSEIGSTPHLFIDEARERFIRWTQNGKSFRVFDWTDGGTALHNIVDPVGADSDLGGNVIGGFLHNGDYVFVAKGSSATDRVSIYVVDPDSLTCTAAYASHSGSSGSVEYARKPHDSSAFVYCVSGVDRKVTKHAIASGGAVTDMGTAAVNVSMIEVDPNTGDLWTGGLSSGTFYATAHEPGGTQPLNYSSVSSMQFLRALTFTPQSGAIFGGVLLTSDIFYSFDDTTYTTILSEAAGGYFGTAALTRMGYSETTDQIMALREGGTMTFGIPSSPTSVNFFIPTTLTAEPDNKYMGEADYNVSVLLGGQPLDEVVGELSEMAGFDPSELDLTALADDMVDGYAIATQTSVREAISALQPVYNFDLIESGGKIKAVKRGGAIVATVPDADLGAYEDGSQPVEPMDLTRAIEIGLPRRLTVEYLLAATNYSKATKYASRLTGSSNEEATMDFPMVLSDTKGQGVAETNLHGMWVARIPSRFTLPYEYAYLEPTDVVAVGGHRLLIKKITQSGTIFKVESVTDGADVYDPHVTVTETPPIEQDVYIPSDTIMELLDVNMLQDTDDDPGFYAAACGTTSSWSGAGLYESRDGGTSYTRIGIFATAATMGYTTTALGDFAGGNFVDESNSITVTLYGEDSALTSTTYEGLLSGVNVAIVGNEIIYFRDATLTGSRTYTLTGLLRGRRGTEGEIAGHEAGDRFVLANSALVRVAQVTADIGVTRTYKGVTSGTAVSSAPAVDFTNTAAGLECYSLVNLGGGRDASGNLTLQGIRRNRTSGEWRDLVDVPMTEAVEAYEWDIFSDDTHTTVIDTLTSSVESVAYSAAAQTAAGITPGDPIYFGVVQVSAVVGRGYMAYGLI
jgi:Putative phage tail protein